MKKCAVILLLSLSFLLSGCGNSVDAGKNNVQKETTPEANETDADYAITKETPETQENNAAAIIVEQGGPYGKISIALPDGWRYETYSTDHDPSFYGMYGIHFYPDNAQNGFIDLSYRTPFGLCGVGLDAQTVTIAGYSATICTYDNHNYWDYIFFKGKNENIIALTNSVDSWQEEQMDQALDILDTLSFYPKEKEGGAYVYNANSEISEIALNLSLKNISATGATLVFNQYDANAPTGELRYGDDYTIEIQKNGTWEEAPLVIDDYGFHAIAYMIPMESTSENEIDWSWLYGSLTPGEYRIRKKILDFRETGNYDEHTIYAYFILY